MYESDVRLPAFAGPMFGVAPFTGAAPARNVRSFFVVLMASNYLPEANNGSLFAVRKLKPSKNKKFLKNLAKEKEFW